MNAPLFFALLAPLFDDCVLLVEKTNKDMIGGASMSKIGLFCFCFLTWVSLWSHSSQMFSECNKETTYLRVLSAQDTVLIVDMLLEEVPYLIEKYELQGSMEWKDWIKKHGGLAFLSLVSLILKVYVKIAGADQNETKRDEYEH